MSTTYKSKVDFWLVCLILVLFLIPVVPVMIWAFSWTAVILCAGLLVLIFYCLFGTKYIVENNILSIKCGCFINDKVDIKNITKIVPTKSIISSPAAAMDRIAIYLSNQRTPVIISPKDKEGFVSKLKSINPNIDTDLLTNEGYRLSF